MTVYENERKHAEGVNFPQDVNVPHLSGTPPARVSTEVMGSLVIGKCCSDTDGIMGGARENNIWHLFQHSTTRVPYYFFQGPNLFGLPMPVQAGKVQTGVPCVVPAAAVHVRNTPVATADKIGLDNVP